MKNKQVYVITGATSFIASGLLRKLIAEGGRVYAICRPNSKQLKRIPASENIKVIFSELGELGTVKQKINEKCDIFFHLGWHTSEKNHVHLQNLNVKYTLDSVILAKALGCHTFVGAGSQAEYGLANTKLLESTATNPVTGYGMAKLCAGQMSRILCEKEEIKHIWARIVSVYGPMDASNTLVSYVIRNFLKGENAQLTKGEQIWDYLYIDDCAEALYLLAERGKHAEVYNVGSGQELKIKEYIHTIQDVIGSKGKGEFGAVQYDNNTPMYLSANISKLIAQTGFSPRTEFRTGIKKILETSTI